MEPSSLRELLEDIHRRYNRRDCVHPDPLEFLYRYEKAEDREIAGLVASGLAYGRVALILKSVDFVLSLLGPSPSEFLLSADRVCLRAELSGFRHRFTPGSEVAEFLFSIASIQKEYGLAGNYLSELVKTSSYIEALDLFTDRILAPMGPSYLLPRPSRGSACKRLHLFMRWMVRRDDVDPGGWNMLSTSELIVPVDVHMFRVGNCLGFTERKAADGKTAMEITDGFRGICPEDPVKYDFALTRFGIQNLTDCSLFKRLFGS
jgi:uncharacterized protein (TIGR02757 family)